jgi:integrase
MARTVRDTNLETRTARLRLATRAEPYWRTIDPGAHLGYYRGRRGGTWVARLYQDGRYRKTALGTADDMSDADGVAILSFAQAQAAARKWFAKLARDAAGIEPAAAGPSRVRDAISDYLADYKRRGGKALAATEAAINAHILPALGDVQLDRLMARRIREWHSGLADAPPRLRTKDGASQPKTRTLASDDIEGVRRRRATANRVLTVLKAALNHAFREGRVPNDEAWRRVKPFREADAARVRYLLHDEARRLVNATDPGLRQMVQAALLTGCRYGELAALRVYDFDGEAGTITIRTAKGGKARHVVLTDDGIVLFCRLAMGKPSDALMLQRPDGKRWGKAHAQRPLAHACRAAHISPAASFHVLRHTYASHLVTAGAPLQVVAANLGHADTRMTEKHYAHLAPNYVAQVIRATMPKLGLVEPTNIAALEPVRAR